jgi:hypothetical protein
MMGAGGERSGSEEAACENDDDQAACDNHSIDGSRRVAPKFLKCL